MIFLISFVLSRFKSWVVILLFRFCFSFAFKFLVSVLLTFPLSSFWIMFTFPLWSTDKEIFKQAKKQNASLSVDQSGNVNIVQKDESGNVNKTETRNLNANEKQNSSNNIITQDLNLDNTSDIKNIIETIKSDQIYQLQTITNGEGFEIKVPDSIIGSFEKTKLVLKDGSVLPDWVEFDPITGEINANPPEDVDKLEFKLIIERDGEIIVKDLAVDVGGDDNAQILDDIENAKFIAFKDQLNKEHENWEEYGSNIINRL